jgi:hypothetical protein
VPDKSESPRERSVPVGVTKRLKHYVKMQILLFTVFLK